jgi:hypothetical protein
VRDPTKHVNDVYQENVKLQGPYKYIATLRRKDSDNGWHSLFHRPDALPVPLHEPHEERIFELFSSGCENCDDRLGKYTCDLGLLSSQDRFQQGIARQKLAEIKQSNVTLGDLTVRTLDVILPNVDQRTGVRSVECPRSSSGFGIQRRWNDDPELPEVCYERVENMRSAKSPSISTLGWPLDSGSSGHTRRSSDRFNSGFKPSLTPVFEASPPSHIWLQSELPVWDSKT